MLDVLILLASLFNCTVFFLADNYPAALGWAVAAGLSGLNVARKITRGTL